MLDAKGRVKSREGSSLDGVDGAKAGIFMPARPRVGQSAGQPLELGASDHKHYVRGIGTVKEETVRGGNERLVFVAVRRR